MNANPKTSHFSVSDCPCHSIEERAEDLLNNQEASVTNAAAAEIAVLQLTIHGKIRVEKTCAYHDFSMKDLQVILKKCIFAAILP